MNKKTKLIAIIEALRRINFIPHKAAKKHGIKLAQQI